MAASCSPLPYIGNKSCIADVLLAIMPPHDLYIEPCMGSAEMLFRKPRSKREIINDYNGDLVNFFRTLQDDRWLLPLIGRIFFSINSELLFQQNKELLRNTPNVLDDMAATVEKTSELNWDDFKRAVAFFENQVLSFSSTGQTFGIDNRDIFDRVHRLIAAQNRIRDVCILHRDYKDAIRYALKSATRERTFILLDPPYKGTESFYNKGSYGKSEHLEIFEFLMEEVQKPFGDTVKFAITYNDCFQFRKEAYMRGLNILTRNRLHNMQQRSIAGSQFQELIIANYDMLAQAEDNQHAYLLHSGQMNLFDTY